MNWDDSVNRSVEMQVRTEEENERFQERMIVSFVVLVFISGVTLALRLYTKLKIVRNLGLDDVSIICAYASAIAMTICYCREAKEVPAMPNAFSDSAQMTVAFKALFASQVTTYLTLFFTKMSFLFQFLRIFPSKRMRIAIYVTMAMVVIYVLEAILMLFLMCRPLSAFWEGFGFLSSECVDIWPTLYVSAALNLFTDIMILSLPLPGLKRLMLPPSQKIGLIAVFLLGIGVCIVSILRIIALVFAPMMYYPSWAGQPIALWTSIEANLALICSCLPLLRPMLVRFFRRIDLHGKFGRGMTYFSDKLKSTGSFSSSSSSSDSPTSSQSKSNAIGSSSNRSSGHDDPGEKTEGLVNSGRKEIVIHTTYEITHADGRLPEDSSVNMFDKPLPV